MDRRCLRFTLPPALVTEPLIYELSRQFDVATNIRRANVTKDSGSRGATRCSVGPSARRTRVAVATSGTSPDAT